MTTSEITKLRKSDLDREALRVCEKFIFGPGNEHNIFEFLCDEESFEIYKLRGFFDTVNCDFLWNRFRNYFSSRSYDFSELPYTEYIERLTSFTGADFGDQTDMFAKIFALVKQEVYDEFLKSDRFLQAIAYIGPSFATSETLKEFKKRGFDINSVPIYEGTLLVRRPLANRFMKYKKFVKPLLHLGAHIDFDGFGAFLFPCTPTNSSFQSEMDAFECCCKYAHCPNIIVKSSPHLEIAPHKDEERLTTDDDCDDAYRALHEKTGESEKIMLAVRILFVHRCLTQMRLRFLARAGFQNLRTTTESQDDPIREFVQTCPHLLKYIGRLLIVDKFSNVAPEFLIKSVAPLPDFLEVP